MGADASGIRKSRKRFARPMWRVMVPLLPAGARLQLGGGAGAEAFPPESDPK